eukprot:Gb_29021 [translate_table: standard]
MAPDFLDMAPWYSGISADLFKTVFDLLVSVTLFVGRFDMRMMQIPGMVENSSYSVARLLAQPSLKVSIEDHFDDLPHGDLLLIGGDHACVMILKMRDALDCAAISLWGTPQWAYEQTCQFSALYLLPMKTRTINLQAIRFQCCFTKGGETFRHSKVFSSFVSLKFPLRREKNLVKVGLIKIVLSVLLLSNSGLPNVDSTPNFTSLFVDIIQDKFCMVFNIFHCLLKIIVLNGLQFQTGYNYPNPSPFTYERRLFVPFEYALQPPAYYRPEHIAVHKPELPVGVDSLKQYDGPQCFAIPGNHGWWILSELSICNMLK